MADQQQTANVVLTADVSNYNRQLETSVQQTEKLKNAVNGLITTVDKVGKGVRKGLFTFAAADAAALTGITLAAGKFQKELSGLRATFFTMNKDSAVANKNFNEFRTTIGHLSAELPASRGEVSNLMGMMAKLGTQSASEAGKATKAIIDLGDATGESATAVGQSLVQLNTQMGTTSGSITKFADQLTVLSAKSNSSASSIVSFASALAPIARTAGISEKNVLSISAAFNKAGQEGFAAGNAFNTMLSDITRMIQDGSPELGKYANLIGVTMDQFKKMDSTERMVKVFKAISESGPRAISVLNQMGIDGIRAQKAIQGLAASGGIEAMLGASQNTEGAAQKGAEAARDNMFTQLDKQKARVEKFVEEAGAPLVEVLTQILTAMNKVGEVLDPIFSGFAKFVAPILALVGGIAGLVAALMSLAKYAGILAMLRMLGNSSFGSAAKEAANRPVPGTPYAMGKNESLRDQGKMGPMQKAGWWVGDQIRNVNLEREAAGKPGLGQTAGGVKSAIGQVGKGLISAPMRGMTWLNNFNKSFIGDATLSPEERGSADKSGATSATKTLTQQFKNLGTTVKAVSTGQMSLSEMANRAAVSAGKLAGTDVTLTETTALLRNSFVELWSVSGKLAAQMGRSLLTNLKQMTGGIGNAVGGFLKAGMQMAAFMVVLDIITSAFSARGKAGEVDEGIKNRTKVYDEALGIATQKILSFSDAVSQAKSAEELSGQANSISVASTVTRKDSLSTFGQGYTSQDISSLNKDDAVGYVRSMGLTDPKEVQAVKMDLVKRFGMSEAQRILDEAIGYSNTPNGMKIGDVTSVLRGNGTVGTVANAEKKGALQGAFVKTVSPGMDQFYMDSGDSLFDFGKGLLGITSTSVDERFQKGIGAAETFAGQQYAKYGEKAGSQANYVGMLSLLDGFKGSAGQKATLLKKIETEYFGGKDLNLDSTDTNEAIIKQLRDSGVLEETFVGVDKFDTSLDKANKRLKRLQVKGDNQYEKKIRESGSVGTDAMMYGLQNAQESSPGSLRQARELLTSSAMLGRGFTDARSELRKMQTAIGDSTDKMYKLAQAAKDYIQYQQDRRIPFQTRLQNFGDSAAELKTTGEAYAANPYDETAINDFDSATKKYEAQQDSYQSFLAGLIQTYRNYSKQMQRAEEDHQLQLKRMVEEGAKSIYDPYTRIAAQKISSIESLVDNMRSQTEAVKRQTSNLDVLKKQGLSLKVIDMLSLGDTGNAAQLQQIYDQILADPTLIAKLNKTVKGKIGASGGLLTSPYNKSYRTAEDDRKKEIARAHQDLVDATTQITGDFNSMASTALSMTNTILKGQGSAITTEINTVVAKNKKALETLKFNDATEARKLKGSENIRYLASEGAANFFAPGFKNLPHEYNKELIAKMSDTDAISVGNMFLNNKMLDGLTYKKFNTLIDSLTDSKKPEPGHSLGIWKANGKDVAYAVYLGKNADGKDLFSYIGNVYTRDELLAQVTYRSPGNLKVKDIKFAGYKQFAEGGIATRPTAGVFAEAGSPEAVIPLNSRGLGFLANFTGMVAREVTQLAYSSPVNRSYSAEAGNTSINRSTNFNGQITVIAQDPNEMARKLESQRRHRALTGVQ